MTAQLTTLERSVTEEIERRREDLVGLLCDLVAFDTQAPDPDYAPRDEAALQDYVARRLRSAGLAVRVWEPEPADLPPSRYAIPQGHHFRGRPQLLATATGGGGGRALLLNGHVDVVGAEPRELWTSDAFSPELRAGRLYGRGACDMKGGVAAMLLATEVLRALAVPLRGDLIVNTVTDEESTGAGSLAVAASGLRADAGIIPEPTGLTAWLGTRGSLMPAITVEGRAGHAGFPPAHWSAGGPVNAIEKMQIVLEALQRLRLEWQLRPDTQHAVLAPGSIVPTALHAGQWMVSYPASARLECHVQYVPGQADDDGYGSRVEAEIEARVLAAAGADPWLAQHPPRFDWPGDAPAGFVSAEAPVSATTLDAMAAVDLPRTVASRTTFFDGPTFTRAGIPTIAFGPGDILRAHGVDEYVPVDQLVRAAQVLAVAAMRFCGVAGRA
jgi:acetylornithine deacetylase